MSLVPYLNESLARASRSLRLKIEFLPQCCSVCANVCQWPLQFSRVGPSSCLKLWWIMILSWWDFITCTKESLFLSSPAQVLTLKNGVSDARESFESYMQVAKVFFKATISSLLLRGFRLTTKAIPVHCHSSQNLRWSCITWMCHRLLTIIVRARSAS